MLTRITLRVLALCVVLCALPAPAEVTATLGPVEFLRPTQGAGVLPTRFRISAPLTFSEPVTGQITTVSLNETIVFNSADRSRDPCIDTLTAAQAHLPGEKIDTPLNRVVVQCYHAWVPGRAYTLALTVQLADGRTVTARSAAATAPAGGAVPGYASVLTLTVKETAGLARRQWPVTVGVPIACEPVADPARFLYLVRSDGARMTPVPFQLFDIVSPDYGPELTAAFAQQLPARTTRIFEIGFPADLTAHGTGTYLLYYGSTGDAPLPAAPAAPLRYLGANPGIGIDTGDVVFSLNPKTGSLLYVTPKFGRARRCYDFDQGHGRRDLHYNPDVWAPPLGWGHTSDWEMDTPGPYTPTLSVAQGPYAYRSFRAGIMPRSNETKTSMVYTFFAGMPFYYASSKMEFTLNTLVNAVRSSEYVFSRGQMTHAVWAGADGRPQEAPVLDPADPLRVLGHVADLPSDTPYLGLFNAQDGVGLCLVTLQYHVSALGLADDAMNLRTQFYIADPGLHMPGNMAAAFTYLVRPEIYYVSAVVPRGTLVVERNAVLIFRVGTGAGRFDDLRYWVKRLRTPPTVDIAPLPLPPK